MAYIWKNFGVFLFEYFENLSKYALILQDADLRVVTESLDKLFDAFSEDYTDNVFFSLNLLPKFKELIFMILKNFCYLHKIEM